MASTRKTSRTAAPRGRNGNGNGNGSAPPDAGSIGATVGGPTHPSPAGRMADPSLTSLASQRAGAEAAVAAMPANDNKPGEFGLDNGVAPPEGAHVELADPVVGASSVQETLATAKLGAGQPPAGTNNNDGSLDRVRVDSAGQVLTTNQGVPVGDNQNSLKAGLRGPALLEDFILREKITHFDHERIPERIVHARGSAAHGVFVCTDAATDVTKADPLSEAGLETPVFVRFSTVAGERGSCDTARDTRGFAVKFYTRVGNWDLVGNNIPVFFIQDAMKFPDLVHAVKPEPHNGIPQAASAHDTFWDFMSLMPESLHHTLWVMSDRGLPRSYRTMQGFGVNTYRLVDAAGASQFVKFHWQPVAGTHSLAWDEAVKIAGADADFHRRDLWEAIESGNFPQWDLQLQVFTEEQAETFPFDVLDATKLVPEEMVPLRTVGRMTLNRNPDNFFAETEQVAFCTAHVVPGIDFSNDPLLAGRIHSYLDTQLSRLGGPNFHEIPINAPVCPIHNNQRDGKHRQAIPRGRVAYEPNSLAGGSPYQAGAAGFVSFPEPMQEHKVRGKPEKFAEHYSQPRLFYRSLSPVEQAHTAKAFVFELSRVTVPAIRRRVVSILRNVDESLAALVADELGLALPDAQPPLAPIAELGIERSPMLSLLGRPGDGSVRGLRVALLVADGCDASATRELQAQLAAAQAVPRFVGLKYGAVRPADGDAIEVEATLSSMPGVLWDAVAVPAAADAMAGNGIVLEFLREQYRHCKPIAAGDTALLDAAGIPQTLADGSADGGIVVGGDAAAFMAALAQRRHHDRETDPPAV